MEITALATALPMEEVQPNIYGTVFYENESGELIMFKSCQTRKEYEEELGHAISWAESEESAVAVRGVPVGGVA